MSGGVADRPVDGGLTSVLDRDVLERAFLRLPIEQRAVVVVRYYLDQSIEQVAATLRIPTGTARSRLHRSTQALRAAVEAEARPSAPPTPSLPEVLG
jgi:RNA polymerase sigma-70 factor (ECF subfamily)